MKRFVLAAAALPLLVGCMSLPTAKSVPAESGPVESGGQQRERWTWTCPQSRTRSFDPDMAGVATARDAAHFFSGKERVQLHRVRPGQRIAIVRGIQDVGPSRLKIYKMRGEWYVDHMKSCEPRSEAAEQTHQP